MSRSLTAKRLRNTLPHQAPRSQWHPLSGLRLVMWIYSESMCTRGAVISVMDISRYAHKALSLHDKNTRPFLSGVLLMSSAIFIKLRNLSLCSYIFDAIPPTLLSICNPPFVPEKTRALLLPYAPPFSLSEHSRKHLVGSRVNTPY